MRAYIYLLYSICCIIYYCYRYYTYIYTFRRSSKPEFYYIYAYDDGERTAAVYGLYSLVIAFFAHKTFASRKWIRIARRFFDFYFRHVSFAKICPPPPRRWSGLETRSVTVFLRNRRRFYTILFLYLPRALYRRFPTLKYRVSTLSCSFIFVAMLICVYRCVCVCL